MGFKPKKAFSDWRGGGDYRGAKLAYLKSIRGFSRGFAHGLWKYAQSKHIQQLRFLGQSYAEELMLSYEADGYLVTSTVGSKCRCLLTLPLHGAQI